MISDRPLPNVLRAMSDESVVRALAGGGRMTRAQLATATGLSKPTVAESVRRLSEKHLISDTGERTTGRGGVGIFYAIADAVNVALAISIAPEGIVVDVLDAAGSELAHVERAVERPATPAVVRRLLTSGTRAALGNVATGQAAVAAVSAADPVDRATGRLVHLPDAPFLVGALDPVRALKPFVRGPVVVDNDVNWAALHERASRQQDGRDPNDFVYLYLGEGLGCAVVSDGEIRRGRTGLAGEVAHLLTRGPGGAAMTFTEVFERLGLRRPGSSALDVDAVLAALARPRLRTAVTHAVAGVIAAAVALCDPAEVVLAGSWGAEPSLVRAVTEVVAASARPVLVTAASEPVTGALAGVRTSAAGVVLDFLAAESRS